MNYVILFQPYILFCPTCDKLSYTTKWILGKYECGKCGAHINGSVSDSLMQIDRDKITTKYQWLRRNGYMRANQNKKDEFVEMIRNEFCGVVV